MKREHGNKTERAKAPPLAAPSTVGAAAPLQASPAQTGIPAKAPEWARYVDSRLKQFCVR